MVKLILKIQTLTISITSITLLKIVCTAFIKLGTQIWQREKHTRFGNAVSRHGSKQPLSAKQLIFQALHGRYRPRVFEQVGCIKPKSAPIH